jgi:sulfatase maturation enzyme AslB (radical SAM superfamily)
LLKEILAQRPDQVLLSLSLDGPEEIHDAIRGKGSYDRALQTFERLRSLDRLLIKINTVVSRENLETLPEFLAETRRMGPDAHSLVLLRGDPRDPEMQVPTAEELRKLLPAVLSGLQHYSYGSNPLGRRLLQSYHRFLWDVSIATLEQRTQVVPCLGGSNHIVVWPDKTVGSCEMLAPTASLENSRLCDVLRSPAWKKQRRFIATKQCWCTHNCALLASIPFHVPSQAKLLFRTLMSQSHG